MPEGPRALQVLHGAQQRPEPGPGHSPQAPFVLLSGSCRLGTACGGTRTPAVPVPLACAPTAARAGEESARLPGDPGPRAGASGGSCPWWRRAGRAEPPAPAPGPAPSRPRRPETRSGLARSGTGLRPGAGERPRRFAYGECSPVGGLGCTEKAGPGARRLAVRGGRSAGPGEGRRGPAPGAPLKSTCVPPGPLRSASAPSSARRAGDLACAQPGPVLSSRPHVTLRGASRPCQRPLCPRCRACGLGDNPRRGPPAI